MSIIRNNIHKISDNLSTINNGNHSLYEIAKDYEYITFDIFDTLVKRDVPVPTDIFKLMANKYGLKDFYRKRILAEEEARKSTVNKEITINDIYKRIPEFSEYENIEKKVEINECNCNKEIIEFYNWAVKHKKVYLITDMYLDRKTIENILNKSQITNYNGLIISNEENFVKSDGSLFHFFLNKYNINSNQVLHIGNSFKADYIGAKKEHIHAIKIPTYINRKMHEYKNNINANKEAFKFLNAFINNHTYSKNKYEQFGYECFGPLLYGFVQWIAKDMEKRDIEQVLFMSRDGFIMKKVYDSLGLNKKIPSFYFEASRRSLRVPNYNESMIYSQMVNSLTVPNLTNLYQVFDSWGLDANNYKNVIKKVGLNINQEFKRSELKQEERFEQLYAYIKGDIFKNAHEELKNLNKYLSNINFEKKVAIIDIGWGGSMQHFLSETLHKMDISPQITGYYIGLTKKSRENLGKENLSGYGYVFDRLHSNGSDLERPFVGLFETLFLEQAGSVKRYVGENDKVIAERYPYEYKVNGKYTSEVYAVKKIQDGALKFAKEFDNSITADWYKYSSIVMFSNLYQVGVYPTLSDVGLFGKFNFFNNGTKVKLADPRPMIYYATHIQQLRKDLYDCQWKIGFLKKLLKIKGQYLGLFELLHKVAN